MSAPSPVLRVTDAVLPDPPVRGGTAPFSLELGPGALALVEIGDPAGVTAVGDLLCGLLAPAAGTVEFAGRPWTEGGPAVQAARRSRIGRVFAGAAWLSNLDVDENVLLAQLYHSARPLPELRGEAADLAHRFGLADLPPGRPAWADVRDLQAAQWVRAWLAHPALFVLEEPAAHGTTAAGTALQAALRESLAAGAAAVWITETAGAGPAAALEPDVRLAIGGPPAAG